ncbi:hypothetical protein PO909_019083 [Leuciscus waleckii]
MELSLLSGSSSYGKVVSITARRTFPTDTWSSPCLLKMEILRWSPIICTFGPGTLL